MRLLCVNCDAETQQVIEAEFVIYGMSVCRRHGIQLAKEAARAEKRAHV